MGFVTFRVELLFVTEFRGAEHLRFEQEFDEVFGAFPLDENFRAFLVDGDTQCPLFTSEEGVGLFDESETLAFEELFEHDRVKFGERAGVRGDRWHRDRREERVSSDRRGRCMFCSGGR